jgi:hypothetical protein
MPRKPVSDSAPNLLSVIRQYPSGVSVRSLEEHPDILQPRRTLQRQLKQLADSGKIVARKQGKSLCYHLPEATLDGFHLSSESEKIKRLLQRPLSQRIPAGYQSQFLRDYKPGKTHYLPTPLKEELSRLGDMESGDLPAGTYLRKIMDRLLIDLSWSSSRLEGNTYSLLETQRLLELGEAPDGKTAKEAQMILNHKAAIEMLADQAAQIGFNRYTLCNIHALLSDNLLADPTVGGRLRDRPVGISGTVFHPLEIPQLIEERFDEILDKAGNIPDPFEQAFFAMVHLPYLQPFEDVNKRLSRLAANIPLIRHNLCPLSFIDVDQEDYIGGIIAVYELNRIEYLRDVFVWAYRRSCLRYSAIRQSLGEPDPFRLRHRTTIGKTIHRIVTERLNPAIATLLTTEASLEIPERDRPKFSEVIQIELNALHPGNIARYRIRPAEFEAWKAVWG